MPNMSLEGHLYPCCATFFMLSSLIETRRKEEYVYIIDRLRNWSKLHESISRGPAHYCGRMMEYNWHVLFTGRRWIEPCDEPVRFL